MKLQDLESKTPTQQSQKVFESHFGRSLDIERMTSGQARRMLSRVRGLIKEHQSTPSFHRSEQDPAYLKLVVMERALCSRVREAGADNNPQADAQSDLDTKNTSLGIRRVATATGQQGKAGVLGKAIDNAVQGKIMDPIQRKEFAKQMGAMQKAMGNPQMANRLQQMLKTATAESRKPRRLREASELQQAQVVLAAQDMVDQIQGMIEDISAMQFKDLPALVNSIRNDIGMDQAQQFNNDVTAALQGLIQGLQGSKTQMESAQGILTGQAPVVPGEQDLDTMAAPADMGMPDVDVDAEVDADVEVEPEPESSTLAKSLGRERR